MNIKSLILGSAAALVAGGAAQAADLPVAEPVDYVKVCNAYGAGYHFIPGTDTCLKINGYVRAEFRYKEPDSRDDAVTEIYAKASLNFTAKEETELGTLVGYMRLEGDSAGATSFNKYYLSIGGLYAGVADNAAGIEYDKAMYGTTWAGNDVGALGYNMDLGNGVTATLALQNRGAAVYENTYNMAAANAVAGDAQAGQSLPDVIAALSVSQGWGSAKVSAAVTQLRSLRPAVSTEYGYAFGAGVDFNLDMLSAGSSISFTGGYAKGAVGYAASLATADADGVAAATIVGNDLKLHTAWTVATAFKYAWTDNFSTILEAAYGNYNAFQAASDAKKWNVGLTAQYLPVKNLIVRVGANYSKTDYAAVSGKQDVDNWSAKLRLQRNF